MNEPTKFASYRHVYLSGANGYLSIAATNPLAMRGEERDLLLKILDLLDEFEDGRADTMPEMKTPLPPGTFGLDRCERPPGSPLERGDTITTIQSRTRPLINVNETGRSYQILDNGAEIWARRISETVSVPNGKWTLWATYNKCAAEHSELAKDVADYLMSLEREE